MPPKLMAGARRSGREPGKSDPIDALAVARAALREPDLPIARLDGPERELRLLVDHRDDLVAERTRAQNRLRWHLHELSRARSRRPRSLDRPGRARRPRGRPGRHDRHRGPHRRASWSPASGELTRRHRPPGARDHRPRHRSWRPTLLALPGCGPLTAAKLVGETAGIGRFRSPAAFARHNGSAPVPVWSGNSGRHRLSRTGNRQLNLALHRIAITQLRLDGPGPRLPRQAHGRRRHQDRGHPCPASPDQRRGLPPDAPRRARPSGQPGTPGDGRLT